MNELEEAQKIIDNSGNSFHCKVNEKVLSLEWYTQVSPYYLDSIANKPREIDLISEKPYYFKDDWVSSNGFVNFRLFMECKYIPQKVVFWFDYKNKSSAYNWLTTNTPFPEKNSFTERHHYLSEHEKVAKLFSEGKGKAQENEVIYKALTQSLNAMVYSRWQESIVPEKVIGRIPILHTIDMPVIVCNSFDNFYKIDMNDSDSLSKITENFQLEVNYAYIDRNGNHRNEYFLIDVVSYDQLENYMNTIDADFDALYHVLGD